MSSNIGRAPQPTEFLKPFSPLVDWVLAPIRHRLAVLGVELPNEPPLEFFTEVRNYKLYPDLPDAELDILKLVINEVGWLTWDNYLHLFVAWRCRRNYGYRAGYLTEHTRQELDEYLATVRGLMNCVKKVRRFKRVFEKVIQRYLLEMEMSEKYKSIVRKRHRDFHMFGRSLNFGWDDIEAESKEITLKKTQKDGKDDIGKTVKDEEFVGKGTE